MITACYRDLVHRSDERDRCLAIVVAAPAGDTQVYGKRAGMAAANRNGHLVG